MATAEKAVTVYEMITLYFINKDAWSTVAAYAYYGDGTIKNAEWPGEVITATGDVTANHGYAVYSIEVVKDKYSTIIFNDNNNGSQTGNLTIDNARPYWYDDAWYATLAECDQPVLTTDVYLVGSIIGAWDPSETYRFMKATEDATEATVTVNITSADNKEFKLKEGDAWRGATEDNVILTKDAYTVQITSDADGHNVTLTPYTSGDYVFTLNLSTRVLTVAYPGGEPMPVSNDIYLLGQMNDWTESDDFKFAVSGDVATLEVTTMEALHEYEFKLKNNGVWLGADYNFKYYWCTDVAFSAGEGNATLNTFKAGTYTFTYNLTSGELSIAFPPTSATSVAISEYEYATLYSATAFDVPNEVEAYVISAVDGTSLTMQRIYRIPANTGVILHAPEGNYDFYEGDGRWMDAPTSNLLNGTLTDEVIPENGLVHYVLSYDNAFQVGFYWPTNTGANQGVGEFTNHAGKAYLEIPVQSQGQGVIARRGFPFFPSADMPTGIESQELKLESAKILHNGQLFILSEGRIYNAQGARVK